MKIQHFGPASLEGSALKIVKVTNIIHITKNSVNVSRISPKLLQTQPHIVENLGDYNGTILFEIDTMKKSSSINLNLCQT